MQIDAALPKEDDTYATMAKGLESTHKKVAYRNINDLQRPYDFHKTKKIIVTDMRNLCVSCHGEIPHYQKKETRAFLNMHASYLACETCHIRFENKPPIKFIWYEKSTGEEREKIALSRFSEFGENPYKLLPVGNDGRKVYDNEKTRKFVTEFKSKARTMSLSDRKTAIELVHRPMTDTENFLACEECHTSDREKAYLPLRQIGYSERRINQLAGNEVVGMINNYKEFYLPHLLTPSEASKHEN